MMKRIATDFLNEMLRIKSYVPEEKQRCASVILDMLTSMGFQGEIVHGFGSPIVIAEYDSKADKNILFYSHYDVKPEGDVVAWNTEPFVPVYDEVSNKIYARGTGDAKGQIFAVIYGIREALLHSKTLSYNVTIVIEGDEESGSVGLDDFCKARLRGKAYDAVIINDSHWFGESPVIYTGTRGQQSINIYYEVVGMCENQHAGNYGGREIGAARKFINILLQILGQIDAVIESALTTEKEYGNAVSLTHISSGDSIRSTIPQKAFAKIDIRFIETYVPKKIYHILEMAKTNYGITYEIIQQEEGFYNQKDEVFIDSVNKIIKGVTGLEPIHKRYSGAYIPMKCLRFVEGIKYVMPFAQADEHNHSPNENMSLRHIVYGIEIIKEMLI